LQEVVQQDEPGVVVCDEIGFDAITLTGKGDGHHEALKALADHGFIITPRERGTNWYKQALDLEGGGIVAWEHRNNVDSWMIEIPGRQWMRDHERARLAVFELYLTLELRCTRVDIRRDQFGRELQLVDRVGESCRGECLCRVRVFDEMERRRARTPQSSVGRGFYLGSRQSDRFVRVYDKGLERGWPIRGWWERFEAQIRGDLADESWHAIVESGDAWPVSAFDHMIGVVDFRMPVDRHATVEERERPAWWSVYCDGRSGVRPSSIRDETDAVRFLRWVCSAVVPTLQAVRERLGVESISDVVRLLDREFESVEPGGSALAVKGLVELLSDCKGSTCAAA
jgi:hypothetical protein